MTPSTEQLDEHVRAARAAWPTLQWSDADYRTWLEAAVAASEGPGFATLVPGEVVLCWAAGRGDAEAVRLVDEHFLGRIAPALGRFGGGAAFVDEITQRVRVKLMVAAPGQAPAIARYALGGSLLGLVRVAAMREAVSAKRSERPADQIEDHDELPSEHDPELRSLKTRYAAEFQRAFTAAVAELAPKDRQLLRLNLSVKASIDDIARMYQTHRATAARWLNAARDNLAEGTRTHLQAQLGIAEHEVQSLLRLVRTEATKLLQSIPPGDDEPGAE